MGGQGVWKVELDEHPPMILGCESNMRHATRTCPSVCGCASSLPVAGPTSQGGGLLVEQPFQERIGEGMIRAYLTHDEVVGFAHQYPGGLRPAECWAAAARETVRVRQARPSTRLRGNCWRWNGCRKCTVARPRHAQAAGDLGRRLPLRAEDRIGDDTYVLCEINASSTFAFPEHAMPRVAEAALEAITAKR